MKALVVLGGDLNRKNGAGKTVYDIAKGESCRSTMKLLSSVGADDDKFLNCKEYPPISPAGKFRRLHVLFMDNDYYRFFLNFLTLKSMLLST